MKQITTILAAFIVSVTSGQIKVDSVTPTRLCPGDSITIYYTQTGPNTLVQFNMDGTNHDFIWQSQIDSSGVIKFKTPFWWNGGTTYISGDWTNSKAIEFCEAVGIPEYNQDRIKTYKQVYGNIYLSNEGKKVIFVQ